MADILTRRDLNRAVLARQMLLARERETVRAAVGRLLAMQAQEPRPPFVGLWSRLDGFVPERLHDALHGREVVRATHARATLHLLTAADYLASRTAIQPMLGAAAESVVRRIGGARPDPERLLATARALLEEGPRGFGAIRELLQPEFPDVNDRALGYAVRMNLPLVMVPTRDRWAFPAAADFTLADLWLGAPPGADGSPAPLVLRYLAAYGPASVADMQSWSGLKGLKPAFEGLRGRLRTFRSEDGRELFDLPDAPRPGPDVPAPARFLPEFDGLVLGYADRRRIVADEHRPRLVTKNLRIPASFLWDGVVRGTWKAAHGRLDLTPFEPLPAGAVEELRDEGVRLLGFIEPDASDVDVRVGPVE